MCEHLEPEFLTLIVQSRWFAAGRENLLGDFRKHMLANRSIKKIVYYPDGHDVFPEVENKGGICYYFVDKAYNGDCNYTISSSGVTENTTMKLDEFDILIRFPQIANIVRKIRQYYNGNYESIESMISNDTPFGIPTNPKKSKKNPYIVKDSMQSGFETALYYMDNSVRKVGYVSADAVRKNADDIGKYKVLVTTGYGAGEGFPHQILGLPEQASSNSVCSQSYLYVAFDTEYEMQAFTKYLKTQFFRILVLAYKITQSAPSKVYRFVPKQDFSKESDIDWSKSVSEINKQLIKKYNLSSEEERYLSRMIKTM